MAAAAILKAVGQLRCCIFDIGRKSRNQLSLVHMVNVINSAKFDHCNFNGLNLARVNIFYFPMLNLTAHTIGLALTRCL
jgi:hypothetical protein